MTRRGPGPTRAEKTDVNATGRAVRGRLTERQQQTLSLINRFINRNGFPPTMRELASELGGINRQGAHRLVTCLVAKGHLVRDRATDRGIRQPRGSRAVAANSGGAANEDALPCQLLTKNGDHLRLVQVFRVGSERGPCG